MKIVFSTILIFISLATLNSCNKSNDQNGTAYLIADINGVHTEFTKDLKADTFHTPAGNILYFLGGTVGSDSRHFAIYLVKYDGAPLQPGAYGGVGTNFGLICIYQLSHSIEYQLSSLSPFTVTIETNDHLDIKGRFTGELSLSPGSDPAPQTVTITNGEFNLLY